MDRVFADADLDRSEAESIVSQPSVGRQLSNGGQMVVKTLPETNVLKTPIPQSLAKSALHLVEMSGFEPLTPYMRSTKWGF